MTSADSQPGLDILLGLLIDRRLAAAGVPASDFRDRIDTAPGNRRGDVSSVAAAQLLALLEAAALALSDEFLGFRLALEFDERQLGAFHYVLASARDLGEGLASAARYAGLVLEGAEIVFRRTADAARLQFEFAGAQRHRDCQLTEFWMALILRECRITTGTELMPVMTRFVHPRPRPLEEMKEFFGAIEFGADCDCLELRPTAVDLPVVTADPYLQGTLVQHLDQALAGRVGGSTSFRHRVENALTRRLPEGDVGVEAIAKEFGLSTRTLARRLAEQGLTFSQVLSDLRADLAQRYIRDPSLPISQISWMLGYKDASAFVVAFRRWTGVSPTEGRATLEAAARLGDEGVTE